jgi:hypothetical protein
MGNLGEFFISLLKFVIGLVFFRILIYILGFRVHIPVVDDIIELLLPVFTALKSFVLRLFAL